MSHLFLLPPSDGQPEPAAPSPEFTEAAIADGLLQQLATNLNYIGRPSDWLTRIAEQQDEDVVVAVFRTDAIPELVSLILRRQP